MAELLNCLVCGGKVASDAPVCPHCGTPNYADKKQEIEEMDHQEHYVNIEYYFLGDVTPTAEDHYSIHIDGRELNNYKNPKFNKHYVEFYGLDPEVCYTHKLTMGHHAVSLVYSDFGFFAPDKSFVTTLPLDYSGEDGIRIFIGVEHYGLLRNKKLKLDSVECVEIPEVSRHCKS